MFKINKIASNITVDFAAEELKKYLRMMMLDECNVEITYNPDANDGFRLGLMKDFGLDTSDSADTALDDVIYVNCDGEGGIIAGDNPRSVLLAVYEYLRQLGCRWLLPGVDGEYIPEREGLTPVSYRHKPSMRYRGECFEGNAFIESQIEFIDFLPKIGMNAYMMQFEVPTLTYYNHTLNSENDKPRPLSERQASQWKRQLEAEMAKRGIQFHDIGHGFTTAPFNIPKISQVPSGKTIDSLLTDEQRGYLAQINGKRGMFTPNGYFTTNFCMSNPKARETVSCYVRDFLKKHLNIDYLHVWLADGTNNHCECDECRKMIPSDYYVILLNEMDEKLTEAGIDTKITFICYVDTFWAPIIEKIKNPNRFSLLFAPIFRSYAYSMPGGRGNTVLEPYKRNKNVFPPDLASSLDYLDEWKRAYNGPIIAFEYHFWRHYDYSLSGQMQARLLYDDVNVYKEAGLEGIIQCGSQRSLFPNGLRYYSYARAMFDTSLTYEEIEEDYLSHAYGACWRDVRDYLLKLEEALPFDFFSRDEARGRKNAHYDPERAKTISSIRDITRDGRELISQNCESDYRVQAVAMMLLEKHADYCDLISDWMAEKARGEIENAEKLLEKARVEFGKYEQEIKKYYDHDLIFSELGHCQKTKPYTSENVVLL